MDMKIYTLEHPGVKAPGTPKIIIFFPFAILARFTLFAGESSKRSIVGSFCPAYISTSTYMYNSYLQKEL